MSSALRRIFFYVHGVKSPLKIPTPVMLNPGQSDVEQQIAALPGTAGVYALAAPGKSAHISWSGNLPRRLARLLVSPYQSSQSLAAKLSENLTSIECWPTGSRLESSLLMYELAKVHYPGEYMKRLRLRTPWFVRLSQGNGFPRLTAANRVSFSDGTEYGPFVSRDAAQRYEEEVEALFQIRRCSEILSPHPEHPGCIYGEMNQCLRPCQQSVTADEYATEAKRVAEFLQTNGKSLTAGLKSTRDRASEEMDFEGAAQLHKRIERVAAAAAARDDVTAAVDVFNGVALTRGLRPRQYKLWLMYGALWQEPVTLDIAVEEAEAKSLDQELRERLSAAAEGSRESGRQAEELALFSRWYFSSWRDGSWFPFRTLKDLNYRRLVREISNLAKADVAAPGAAC